MAFGHVNLTLRPLRFAFLVDPFDHHGILQAIELSTLLWGGTFNPIIPVFRRSPKAFRDRSGPASAKAVAEGLIQAFDPDYVVLVGNYISLTIAAGYRTVIRAADILAGFGESWSGRYGITIFELLAYFIDKELRFVPREPVDVRVPSYSGQGSLFLASVFGALPGIAQRVFDEHFASSLDARSVPCALSDYVDHLGDRTLFLRRLGSFFVRPLSSGLLRKDYVFLLDATKALDIVDYWNLRAVGCKVMPVAIQASDSVTVRSAAKEFIEANFWPCRGNPNMYNSTTLLKSRSLSSEQLRVFGKGLDITHDAAGWGKYTYQDWFPRIWNEWARGKDGVEPAALQSRTRTIDFSNGSMINVRTLDPKFAVADDITSEVMFANEVGVRTYGAADLVAEVIPEGDDTLVRAIGGYDFRHWRFSPKGPVYLSGYLESSLHLSAPDAETVFIEWLRSRGWKAELSPPGLIAKQLLRQVQGIWAAGFLANDNMIRLLGDLQGEKPIGLDALRGKLSRIANEQGHGSSADTLLELLVEKKVLRLGIEVQCSGCTRHSWYSVTESDYELVCRKCNERFHLPVHNPKEIGWAYMTVGPCNLPGRADGVYSVLLTYRFFSVLLQQPTTPLLSFTATKGTDTIEADLALFLREARFGRSTIETLFAECKTYNHFKREDIDRMLGLSKGFPGAILVFATLRKNLTEIEKKLMRPLVNRGRKYWKEDRPYNPVLILTATELFESYLRPEQAWEKAGGQYAPWAGKLARGHLGILELCDATQQIYLGMKPWRQWLLERSGLKR